MLEALLMEQQELEEAATGGVVGNGLDGLSLSPTTLEGKTVHRQVLLHPTGQLGTNIGASVLHTEVPYFEVFVTYTTQYIPYIHMDRLKWALTYMTLTCMN